VDMDVNMPADHHGEAFDFLSTTDLKFDTILLDPPYSLRKSREKYEGRCIGAFTKIKDICYRALNPDGRVIICGYSSTGMSRSRGFEKKALCVVCHNGDHDDTICTVEDRLQATNDKDYIVTVEDIINHKRGDDGQRL
jgi:hypothetical protein